MKWPRTELTDAARFRRRWCLIASAGLVPDPRLNGSARELRWLFINRRTV
jgi:hypothetical protein